MLVCPSCGAKNLEGADYCEHCHQPLNELSIRVPTGGVEAGLLRDTVSLLPRHQPQVVQPTTPVGEVLKQLAADPVGCVLVVDSAKPDQLAGIFSERDALMRLDPESSHWRTEPIERYMTPNPSTVPADAKIAFALHKMNHGAYRHLPLMEGDRAVSILTVRDVLQYLTHRAKSVALGAKLLGGAIHDGNG
ncbi:MAG: CBS domain-containing protein [Planctomycetota bacterium]